MSDWESFWHMGGYAGFVWSSYGLAAVVLVANIIAPMLAARRQRQRLERQRKLARRQS